MKGIFFENEVMGAINGDYDAQYDIEVAGKAVISSAKFRLKNPIITQGTPLNADALNGKFDFDNLAAMSGVKLVPKSNPDGSIIEIITFVETNKKIATREVSSGLDGSIDEIETVYQSDGVKIQRRTKIHSYLLDGVPVSEVTSL